jgi:hypothetical protein
MHYKEKQLAQPHRLRWRKAKSRAAKAIAIEAQRYRRSSN